jgi:hypothetical protein
LADFLEKHGQKENAVKSENIAKEFEYKNIFIRRLKEED